MSSIHSYRKNVHLDASGVADALSWCAAGGFESEGYDGIIYNPTVGTASGSSGAAVPPNTNAIVNFTMRLQQISEASWTGSDGSNPSGQDRYVYTLTTWLRTHASPYAYAEVTSYIPGSITAQTATIIPYSSTNSASSSNAAAAVATLQSTLSSNSASIFDPQIFGTTTATGITSSGRRPKRSRWMASFDLQIIVTTSKLKLVCVHHSNREMWLIRDSH